MKLQIRRASMLGPATSIGEAIEDGPRKADDLKVGPMAAESKRIAAADHAGGLVGIVVGVGPDVRPEPRQPERNAAMDGVLVAMFTSGLVLTFKA